MSIHKRQPTTQFAQSPSREFLPSTPLGGTCPWQKTRTLGPVLRRQLASSNVAVDFEDAISYSSTMSAVGKARFLGGIPKMANSNQQLQGGRCQTRMSRRFTIATLDPLNKNQVFFFEYGDKSHGNQVTGCTPEIWIAMYMFERRYTYSNHHFGYSYVWQEIYMFQPSFSVSFFLRGVYSVLPMTLPYLPTNLYVPMSDPKKVIFLWQVSWSGSLVLLKDQGGREVDVLLLSMEKNPKQSPNTYETM